MPLQYNGRVQNGDCMLYWIVFGLLGCQEKEPLIEPSSEPSNEDTALTDADEDGIPEDIDCDDADPNIGFNENDLDCDGVLKDEDCDDTDSTLGAIQEDADCDGVLTDDDCDDSNPNAGSFENDADCDGTEELFFLAPNGVTVLCPNAAVGDVGLVNEIEYTKRDYTGLDDLVDQQDWSGLEQSCTSGVTSTSELFRGSLWFHQSIHW